MGSLQPVLLQPLGRFFYIYIGLSLSFPNSFSFHQYGLSFLIALISRYTSEYCCLLVLRYSCILEQALLRFFKNLFQRILGHHAKFVQQFEKDVKLFYLKYSGRVSIMAFSFFTRNYLQTFSTSSLFFIFSIEPYGRIGSNRGRVVGKPS